MVVPPPSSNLQVSQIFVCTSDSILIKSNNAAPDGAVTFSVTGKM